MTRALALLDTDSLSDIMKGRDALVRAHAYQYVATFGHFTFSIITRDEILRGLKARGATHHLGRFEQQCQRSTVLPLTDAIIVRAADMYAMLYCQGSSSVMRTSSSLLQRWSTIAAL